MKFCTNCGDKLDDDWVRCPACKRFQPESKPEPAPKVEATTSVTLPPLSITDIRIVSNLENISEHLGAIRNYIRTIYWMIIGPISNA